MNIEETLGSMEEKSLDGEIPDMEAPAEELSPLKAVGMVARPSPMPAD